MTQVIKVAKIGKSTDSTDPNDFIFHSDYNTFKIILEGTKQVTLAASTANQTFTQAHGFNSFVPLVSAFAKRDGVAQVFLPNGVDVETYGAKAGFDGDIKFNYVATNPTNIVFNFDNNKASEVVVDIRYFLLEKV
jgi:hypothetical protein